MNYQVHLSTRAATLSLLFQKGEVSASNLALSLGISVQAMRRHVPRLKLDGLVDSIAISFWRGRSSKLCNLTNQGFNRFFNSQGTEKFSIEPMSSSEGKFSLQLLMQILNDQIIKKASFDKNEIANGAIFTRLKKLVELIKKEVDMNQFYEYKDDSKSLYLDAFYCSIKTIEQSFSIVFDQELQLIRNIFPKCEVEYALWPKENGKICDFKITPHI